MSKPVGVTNRAIARKFKVGYSIKGLAGLYKCAEWEIQNAIRGVMNKRKAKP